MTAPYVLVKGDRVRRESWGCGEYVDVDHVGRNVVVGIDECDSERTMVLSVGEWIKVETPTPLPERWINAYPEGYGSACWTRQSADRWADGTRIALVHIWTDADGVDRIERVTA